MAPRPVSASTYYLLKVKGKAKIPDYIQVRDAHFTLIGYFRPGRGARHSERSAGADAFNQQIEALAAPLAYGLVTRVELEGTPDLSSEPA